MTITDLLSRLKPGGGADKKKPSTTSTPRPLNPRATRLADVNKFAQKMSREQKSRLGVFQVSTGEYTIRPATGLNRDEALAVFENGKQLK